MVLGGVLLVILLEISCNIITKNKESIRGWVWAGFGVGVLKTDPNLSPQKISISSPKPKK